MKINYSTLTREQTKSQKFYCISTFPNIIDEKSILILISQLIILPDLQISRSFFYSICNFDNYIPSFYTIAMYVYESKYNTLGVVSPDFDTIYISEILYVKLISL